MRWRGGTAVMHDMSFGSRLVSVCLMAWLTAGAGPATAAAPSKEQYRSYAMTHQGDPSRGKALFFDPQRIACGACHSVNGKGGKVGPDLSAVGDKFGRSDIVEAILNPSASIAVEYSTTVIKTKSGEAYAGIMKETSDTGVSLMGSDGKLARIPATEIERQRTIDLSQEGTIYRLNLDRAAFR